MSDLEDVQPIMTFEKSSKQNGVLLGQSLNIIDAVVDENKESNQSSQSSSDDEEIQRPAYHKKAKGTPLYKSHKGDDDKRHTKGERTPSQIAAWSKATATRKANREARMTAAIAAENAIKEENRKVLEERIVKKAVSIKKRELKKVALIDEIESDDEPIEEVKAKVRAVRATREKVVYREQPKPLYTFI